MLPLGMSLPSADGKTAWILVECGEGAPWTHLHLIRMPRLNRRRGRPRKNNYHLAWNGERWANGVDYKTAQDREPELLTALEAQLRRIGQ